MSGSFSVVSIVVGGVRCCIEGQIAFIVVYELCSYLMEYCGALMAEPRHEDELNPLLFPA